MADLVLTAQDFRILDGLRVSPRKSFSGRVRGERLTKKKGVSIEFDDYREYSDGDDLRHLDWNVFARLDHSVIKTYRDEEDLAVHIVLDASASMSFGEPQKIECGKGIACAIGYVALCGGDAVYPSLITAARTAPVVLRGRVGYHRLAAWANGASPVGKASLASSLRSFATSQARPGMAVLITDALDPEICPSIRILAGRGHEVWVLQVLADFELRPDLEGDLRLIDSETAANVEITANSMTLREYTSRLRAHNEKISEECLRAGGRYALVESGFSVEQTVREVFRKKGWFAA